jgi:hypothetical protein
MAETKLKQQAITRPTWTAPTFENNWVNYDINVFNPTGYYKDTSGRVYLRGLIKAGTVGNNIAVFTLPAGYRPYKQCIFIVDATGAYGRVDIFENGKVIVLVGNNTYVTLDGISFFAEQ